jgi:uncharacterized protein YukE
MLTKIKRGKALTCRKCQKEIIAGQQYYRWEFRYGPACVQHVACGYPKASQLTQSKMSTAYAAIETAEDVLNGTIECVEDIAAVLNDCAGEIRSVADEYQEGIDNMPEGLQQGAVAQESEEKIEQLNSFADSLEEKAGEIESATNDDFTEEEPEEPDEEETELEIEEFTAACAEWETKHAEWAALKAEADAEWLSQLVSDAQDVLGEHEF